MQEYDREELHKRIADMDMRLNTLRKVEDEDEKTHLRTAMYGTSVAVTLIAFIIELVVAHGVPIMLIVVIVLGVVAVLGIAMSIWHMSTHNLFDDIKVQGSTVEADLTNVFPLGRSAYHVSTSPQSILSSILHEQDEPMSAIVEDGEGMMMMYGEEK